MKRTAREGVKRGKRRAANQKVAPEGMTSDTEKSAGHKKSKPSRLALNTSHKQHDVMVKKVANGRLPPLVPPVKISTQKSNEIELHEHSDEGKRKRRFRSEEGVLESFSIAKDKTPALRTPSPATRRRNDNMTSYERMLQREKRRSRKRSTGSYAMLQSEPEEEMASVADDNTLVVDGETINASRSNASLRSRSSVMSSRQDPNHALLQYFAKLSSSDDVDDSLDLEHIQSLLREGASVNASDRFGQTLLHEVSRTWGVDVAQFLVEQGKSNQSLVIVLVTFYLRHKEGGNVS